MPTYLDSNLTAGLEATLGEKECIALFNAGTMLTMSQGEVLLKKNQRNRGMCLVLSGSFEALGKQESGDCHIFAPGDLVDEQIAFGGASLAISVIARELSRVLTLSKIDFDRLGPGVHSALIKHVTVVQNARIQSMKKSMASLALQRTAVTGHMLSEARTHRKKYENSELIRNLIKRIPRLPIHITQLIEMLLSDKVSAKRVTELAKQDPSLVGEVLKEVNSPYYGIRQKVSDLYYAIMLIGFNEVYQILVSKGIRKTMPDLETFREIHQHSVILSYIAFEICQLCDKQESSLLSTIGLLHDIGKSTVLLIEKENPKLSFFIQLLDPFKIGSMLLEGWNIPTVISETIEYQSFPKFAPPSEIPSQFRKYIGIIHLAHAIHDKVRDKSIPVREYPFLGEYKEACNLKGRSFDQLYENVTKNLRARAHLLPLEVKKFALLSQ